MKKILAAIFSLALPALAFDAHIVWDHYQDEADALVLRYSPVAPPGLVTETNAAGRITNSYLAAPPALSDLAAWSVVQLPLDATNTVLAGLPPGTWYVLLFAKVLATDSAAAIESAPSNLLAFTVPVPPAGPRLESSIAIESTASLSPPAWKLEQTFSFTGDATTPNRFFRVTFAPPVLFTVNNAPPPLP